MSNSHFILVSKITNIKEERNKLVNGKVIISFTGQITVLFISFIIFRFVNVGDEYKYFYLSFVSFLISCLCCIVFVLRFINYQNEVKYNCCIQNQVSVYLEGVNPITKCICELTGCDCNELKRCQVKEESYFTEIYFRRKKILDVDILDTSGSKEKLNNNVEEEAEESNFKTEFDNVEDIDLIKLEGNMLKK